MRKRDFDDSAFVVSSVQVRAIGELAIIFGETLVKLSGVMESEEIHLARMEMRTSLSDLGGEYDS